MQVESYTYTVLAAAMGMAIVFLFLWFLSGVMTILRRSMDRSPEAEAKPRTEEQTTARDDETSEWIVAAVVAFLDAEARDAAPEAAPWVNTRWHREDAPRRGQ